MRRIILLGLVCFLLAACGPSKAQIATNEAQSILSTQAASTQVVEDQYKQSFFEICKNVEQMTLTSRQATGPIWFLELRSFPDVSTNLDLGEIDQSLLGGAGTANLHSDSQTLACIIRTWMPIETCEYKTDDSASPTYKISRYRIDTSVYLVDISSKTALQQYSFTGAEPKGCPYTIPEESFTFLNQIEYDGASATWDEITQTANNYWSP